jgi:hypothetical protein
MTHACSPPAASARFGLAQAIRALPYASFTFVVAVVVTCGAGIANMPSSWAKAADGPPIEEAAAAAEPTEGAAEPMAGRARPRCTGCGVVESIRPLALVADQPAEFEFTVRLRDGSARVSRTVGRAKWHSGDRIVLMGGAGVSRE